MPFSEIWGVGRDPKYLGRVIVKQAFVVPNATFTQGEEVATIALTAAEAQFPLILTDITIKVSPIALGANVSLPRVEFTALGSNSATAGIPASADGADNTYWTFDKELQIGRICDSAEAKVVVAKFYAANIVGVFTFALSIVAVFREF